MTDQNQSTPSASDKKPDNTGVVEAPFDPTVDNLPQGAVFTEVPSDRVAPPIPVMSRAPIPAPQARTEQSQLVTPPPADKILANKTKNEAQKTANRPPKPHEPEPTVAIIIAVALFVLLAGAAYLAYSHGK